MESKFGNISKKELIFYGIYFVHLLFTCWPGLFFGNSAHPFILGFPFFIIYQWVLAIVIVVVFIIQYFKDDRDGEMDFDVEPGRDYLKVMEEMKEELKMELNH